MELAAVLEKYARPNMGCHGLIKAGQFSCLRVEIARLQNGE